MTPHSPLEALRILGRELTCLRDDAGREGAGLSPRIEDVERLLGAVGHTLRRADAPVAHEARTLLAELQARQRELEGTLRDELGRIGAELAQLRQGRDAAASYTLPARPARVMHLDRVG